MFTSIGQQEIQNALERERGEGKDAALDTFKQPGKEFPAGFAEFSVVLKKDSLEKRLYLHVFPTFETRYSPIDLPLEFENQIRREINDFWNSPDQESERVIKIS